MILQAKNIKVITDNNATYFFRSLFSSFLILNTRYPKMLRFLSDVYLADQYLRNVSLFVIDLIIFFIFLAFSIVLIKTLLYFIDSPFLFFRKSRKMFMEKFAPRILNEL